MNVTDLAAGLLYFAVFAGVGCLALRVTWNHRATLTFQTRLFLCALVVRFAVAVLLYQGGLVSAIRDRDSSGWVVGQVWAQEWAEQGHTALDVPALLLGAYTDHHKGYYYLLATLFFCTGLPGRLPAAAVDCLSGSLTAVLTYRLARSLFSEKVARLAGWMMCLFPSMIVWSAQTLKEPVVILLETLVLYGCVRLRQSGFTPRHLLLVVGVSVLLFPFRFYAAYLAGAVVVIGLLIPRFGRGGNTVAAGLGVAAVVLVFLALLGNQLQKEVQQQHLDIEYIERFREGAARGQHTGVKIDADLHTPTGMGYSLLVGGAHLLLAPFPWQWGASMGTMLVVPDVLLWWAVLAYGVLPGLRHAVRNRFLDILPLLLFLGGMAVLYSLTFGNVGLVYRQRAQLMPLLLIFAAVGIELRRLARPRRGPEPGRHPGARPEGGLPPPPEALPKHA